LTVEVHVQHLYCQGKITCSFSVKCRVLFT